MDFKGIDAKITIFTYEKINSQNVQKLWKICFKKWIA